MFPSWPILDQLGENVILRCERSQDRKLIVFSNKVSHLNGSQHDHFTSVIISLCKRHWHVQPPVATTLLCSLEEIT